MVITQITADTPVPVNIEILANTIKNRTREAFIKTHVVGSKTDNVVCATIAETCRKIHLCGCTAINHHLNAGIGIDIYQANLMGYRVAAIVNESYLYTVLMMHTDIDKS